MSPGDGMIKAAAHGDTNETMATEIPRDQSCAYWWCASYVWHYELYTNGPIYTYNNAMLLLYLIVKNIQYGKSNCDISY